MFQRCSDVNTAPSSSQHAASTSQGVDEKGAGTVSDVSNEMFNTWFRASVIKVSSGTLVNFAQEI